MIAIQQISSQTLALFGIQINWWHGVLDFVTITIAYLLALPIGWHRLKAERGIGLRTYPLVAIASCTFLLIGEAFSGDAKADPRLIQGLMTGIGFLGAGSLLSLPCVGFRHHQHESKSRQRVQESSHR